MPRNVTLLSIPDSPPITVVLFPANDLLLGIIFTGQTLPKPQAESHINTCVHPVHVLNNRRQNYNGASFASPNLLGSSKLTNYPAQSVQLCSHAACIAFGQLSADQPKHDFISLGDRLHIYRGLLGGFPDALAGYRNGFAKRKNCQKLTIDPKMKNSQLAELNRRTRC
ncbi:sorting nexin [Culex quinquefasciatus]|uniref:Sorting nexin n=1 Tax=Culex quinquefasciatus TaxID=7176 RepID=B0X1G4_CULQU|nr:sorting nexin [Culex quinquefasciatus]|eukprot:XP_001863488.1 sorting nexin [Culex quinquefasciatus]